MTAQMKQLQEMQMNLQKQMAGGAAKGGPSRTNVVLSEDDDNSFLNEDLPNLAA